jgi:hypothetical protein
MTGRRFTGWLLLLVCGLTAVSYYPGLSGDYMFDDMANILNNQRLGMESLDPESIYAASMSSGSGVLRRPVSMFSFALNRHFFGDAPRSWKVINLGIHLLTGLALFLFSRLLLRSYRNQREPATSDLLVTWLPLVVTGLWLVHPLNLTSVLYIVQRMTSLSALFAVCGLLFYVLGRSRSLAGRRGMPLILAGFVTFGGLAIFSKENGALLPLFMLVVEMTIFRFRNARGELDKLLTGFFTLTVVIPGVVVLAWLATTEANFLSGYHMRDFTLLERVLTESRVLVFYLKMIILPSISDLGLYHDDITISRGLLEPPTTLLSILALTGLLLTGLLLVKKQPLISLGILWFFCAHLLESTIFPLEIVHEHRNYLATFGILLAISGAIAALPYERLGVVIPVTASVMFISLFSYNTWLRAGQWSDNYQHATYEALHHPQAFRAVYVAGRINARLALAGSEASVPEAYKYLQQANSLSDTDIMPLATMIKLSYLLDRPVKQAWFDEMSEKLSTAPVTPNTINSLYELASCMNGRCSIPHETMEKMFALLMQSDSLEQARGLQAEAATVYGYFTINVRGNFLRGLELFSSAVTLDPKETQRWINLIKLLIHMNKIEEAEHRLAVFRQTRTHSGNNEDYQRLQQAIDAKRTEINSQTAFNTRDNS